MIPNNFALKFTTLFVYVTALMLMKYNHTIENGSVSTMMAAFTSLNEICIRKSSKTELSDELVVKLLKFFKPRGILNLADDKEWEDLYDKLIIADVSYHV